MDSIFFINNFDYFFSHRFNLLKELNKKVSVAVACDTSNANVSDLEECVESNIEVIHIKNTAKEGVLGKFIQCKSQLKVLNDLKPQNALFVTLESSIIGIIASFVNRKINYYFLITGLGPFFKKKTPKYISFKCIALFLIFICSPRHHFIVQNIDDENYFRSKVKKLTKISGNGVCTNEFKFLKRSSTRPSFLFLSRLVKSKGINDYLEAVEDISKEHRNISFKLGGIFDDANPESIDLTLFNKIKSHPQIIYLGEVTRRNLARILRESDIFILGSEREGMPQAILEAASTGMPIITTNVPGCRECIDSNGCLYEYGNVKQLIKSIKSYIDETGRIQYESVKSRELVIKNFEIKKIADNFLKIMKN